MGRRGGVPDGGDTPGHLIPAVAGTLLNNGRAAGSATTQDAFAGMLIPTVARTITTREGQRMDPEIETLLPMPFSPEQVTSSHNRSNPQPSDVCPTLTGSSGQPPAVSLGAGVRRLLPVECERLQGFPDGWTDVPYRGKRAADSNRYKVLGNTMAVPCMRWIGQRIAMVDAIANTKHQRNAHD